MAAQINLRTLLNDNKDKAQKRFNQLADRANAMLETGGARSKELTQNLPFAMLFERTRASEETLSDLLARVEALEAKLAALTVPAQVEAPSE